MPTIERTARIAASPEQVYDVISRVEDYPRFSPAVRRIDVLAPGRYRWIAGPGLLRLEWEAEITAAQRPHHFAWRSLSGFTNSGSWDLAPAGAATKVRLRIEYHLTGTSLDRALHALAAPLLDRLGHQLLECVRVFLEQAPPAGSK
jgi:uncharacterized membrane protein